MPIGAGPSIRRTGNRQHVLYDVTRWLAATRSSISSLPSLVHMKPGLTFRIVEEVQIEPLSYIITAYDTTTASPTTDTMPARGKVPLQTCRSALPS